MYNITEKQYEEVKNQLLKTIGGNTYWSGNVKGQFEDGTEYTFVISVVVYRSKEDNSITDLVPVWWEFHTIVNGEEKLNDFLFSTMKELK